MACMTDICVKWTSIYSCVYNVFCPFFIAKYIHVYIYSGISALIQLPFLPLIWSASYRELSLERKTWVIGCICVLFGMNGLHDRPTCILFTF